MCEKLFYINFLEWFKKTIGCMGDPEDIHKWHDNWVEVYKELGGKNSSGGKYCPCYAAYGIWRFWLNDKKPDISDDLIIEAKNTHGNGKRGANIALGLIAVRLLHENGDTVTWQAVRNKYNNLFDHTCRKSEQNVLKVARIIYENY